MAEHVHAVHSIQHVHCNMDVRHASCNMHVMHSMAMAPVCLSGTRQRATAADVLGLGNDRNGAMIVSHCALCVACICDLMP